MAFVTPFFYKIPHYYNLVAEMINYSKKHYSEQFGNDEFYTVIMPSYGDVKTEELDVFKAVLAAKNLKVMDFSTEIKYGKQYTLKHDNHPNSTFTKMFSKMIYAKLNE